MRNHHTAGAPDRARAQRLIHAYAAKAARIIAGADTRPMLRTELLVSQARRQLNVRLWHDLTPTEFYGLAEDIAELRTMRATGWDLMWDSPQDKDMQIGRHRQSIHAEIQALTYEFKAVA